MKKRQQSRIDKKISTFSMVCIAVLAIFSLQNVMDNYVGLGLSATVAFIIALVVFMCPFIFMIAEFASMKKSTKSGLTSWINVSVGRKMAFLTSFMFWFANLTYFFSAVPQRINFLSFAVTGSDMTENSLYAMILPAAAVVFFIIITFVSTLNTKKISKITSFSGTLMMGVTAFFFVMCIIGWITGAVNPDLLNSAAGGTQAPGIAKEINMFGDSEGLNFAWMSTFIWVLMAADGGQTLGVYVKDVKGGKRAFTRAMMISILAIGAFYILGTLLTSVFPPVGGLAAGWANSFNNVFWFILNPLGVNSEVIQQIAFIIMGLIFFLTSVGGILIWTSAPVKTMFSEISPGIFGSKLSKENKNGVCSFGSWIQLLCVIPFMVLLLIPYSEGSGVSDIFATIKSAAGWIGMLPWLVIFLSYVNLRRKHDDEERSFKMGPRWFGMSVGIMLTVITIAILVITFLDVPFDKPYGPDPSIIDSEGKPWPGWSATWWLPLVLKAVMIGIILVPAYCWYYFKFEYQQRDTKMMMQAKLATTHALIRYNFSKQIVMWLNPSIYKDYVTQRNTLSKTYDSQLNEQDKLIKKLAKKVEKYENNIDKLEVKITRLNQLLIKSTTNNQTQIKKYNDELKQLSNANTKEALQKIQSIKQNITKLEVEMVIAKENAIKSITTATTQMDNNKIKIGECKTEAKTIQIKIKQILKQEKVEIKTLKVTYKENVKKYISEEKSKTKQFYNTTFAPMIEQLKADKTNYKNVMLQELKSTAEKDIAFDNGIPRQFTKMRNHVGSQYYNKFGKINLSDGIYYDKENIVLVRNWANSYVGEKIPAKDVVAFIEPQDMAKSVMVNGKYVKLDLINIVHVENNQFRSIKFYLEHGQKFVNYINK